MTISWEFRKSAFKALVRPHLENPDDWIPHGIGKLSKIIKNSPTDLFEEIRIHVWHPDIVLIGLEEGAIHNHDHDYESFVIAGTLADQAWSIVPKDQGDWQIWEHRTAEGTVRRGYAAANGGMKVKHEAGEFLKAPASEWHLTIVDEVAITLVRRTRQARYNGKSFAIARKEKEVQDGLINCICSGGIENALQDAKRLVQ